MLAELLPTLLPHPLLAAAGALAGGLAGATVLVDHAARRTLEQPVAMALDAETTVLAGVLADLRRYPYLATLSAADFATTSGHNIWAALREVTAGAADLPEDISDADAARVGADLAARHESLVAALYQRLGATASPEADRARVTELLSEGRARGYHPRPAAATPELPDTSPATGPATDPAADPAAAGAADTAQAAADAEVVTAAEAVLAAGNDRNRLSGAGLIVPATNPNSLDPNQPPLIRAHTPPSPRRRVAAGAATGVTGALLPGFAALTGFTGAGLWLAALAFAILAVTSVVISLVDIDTLYIDMRTWAAGTVAGWVAVAAATLTAGDPGRMVAGVVMVAAVAALFEGANLVFRKLRGMDGQGFGDTLVILATVGIPPALTGDWRVGYWSMMGGLVAGIVGWVLGRVAGRVTRATPFAFGPWLAAGWVLAMVWCAFDSLLMRALS